MDQDYKYCRREADWKDYGKLCGNRIDKKNALNWCESCRSARLPFWPADEPTPAEVAAAETCRECGMRPETPGQGECEECRKVVR